MAHFLGAVSEIRTSGLIPPWLGSSASQPVEDRTEKVSREDREELCGWCVHGAGPSLRFLLQAIPQACLSLQPVWELTWWHVHADDGDIDLLQGDQNSRVGLLDVGTVRLRAQHGVDQEVVGVVDELDLSRDGRTSARNPHHSSDSPKPLVLQDHKTPLIVCWTGKQTKAWKPWGRFTWRRGHQPGGIFQRFPVSGLASEIHTWPHTKV